MIKIDDEYIINATENCYTLEKISTVQDCESQNYGKETKSIQGYYTSMQNALKGYLKCKMRKFVGQEKTNSINDFIKYLDKIEKFLKDMFGDI